MANNYIHFTSLLYFFSFRNTNMISKTKLSEDIKIENSNELEIQKANDQ